MHQRQQKWSTNVVGHAQWRDPARRLAGRRGEKNASCKYSGIFWNFYDVFSSFFFCIRMVNNATNKIRLDYKMRKLFFKSDFTSSEPETKAPQSLSWAHNYIFPNCPSCCTYPRTSNMSIYFIRRELCIEKTMEEYLETKL